MTVVNFNYPKFKYTIASTGQPGAGYKLFTYEEGTSTKKTTWTTLAKVAQNTNPIILDANGECDVWIDGNYKFVLALPTDTDPPTSPVWTWDTVRSTSDVTTTSSTSVSPTNGSFETDTDSDGIPDNWTESAYAGGTVAIDSTTSTHGNESVKFTSTGSGGGTLSTDEYYEVEAGKSVGVHFSIISADATTLNKVQVYWYNKSKVYLSTSDAYNDGVTNPTSWTRKYTNVTAPATAKYARIVITGVDPASATHSSTNFDNIELDTKFIGQVTATPAELNTMDGITASTAELNKLDGATVTTAQLNFVTGVTSSIQTQINNIHKNLLHVQEQQASGTNGGGSSAGLQTRTLNTVLTNEITGASLAANEITLPVGTYEIEASTPASNVGVLKGFLYNVTDTANILVGTNGYSAVGTNSSDRSFIRGRFTLAGIKNVSIRLYAGGATASIGLGWATTSGDIEVYTDVQIRKIS